MHSFRRRYRELGLFQIELAELCGVNPSTVWRWERGELPVPVYAETIVEMWSRLGAEDQRAMFRWIAHGCDDAAA